MRTALRIILLGMGVAAVPGVSGAVDVATDKPQVGEEVLLAQAGEVEVFFDRHGRRIFVDAWTGEIIWIEPRHQQQIRGRRLVLPREPAPDDLYGLDELEDEERRYLDRLYELGRVPPPPGGNYRRLPPEPYPGEDDFFPDAPPPPDDWAAPEGGERRRVERSPLEPPRQSAAVPEGSGEVIVERALTFDSREEVAELQILLDRAGASPGVIDGRFGSNVDKALAAYADLTGKVLRSTDREGIKKALQESGGEAFTEYTISAEDAAGPFIASVPEDYSEKAQLERMSYTSVAELLAERFHMDEKYLRALNPDANFGRPGTTIRVANVGKAVATKVARVVADKSRKQVRAYDSAGKMVAAYPATIGSPATPSPSGTHTVTRVVHNPDYTYNPKLNFKQGQNDRILKVPPGPNGPVGSIWIALSKPTYGIHGTPEPSKIGKTESNGCVRLTNWDAKELAELVSEGVVVEFAE